MNRIYYMSVMQNKHRSEILKSEEMVRFERLNFLKKNSYNFMERAGYQVFKFIKDNFNYVGDNFAYEARKIHYGKKDKKPIYGKATKEDVVELNDEGIEVASIPWVEEEN